MQSTAKICAQKCVQHVQHDHFPSYILSNDIIVLWRCRCCNNDSDDNDKLLIMIKTNVRTSLANKVSSQGQMFVLCTASTSRTDHHPDLRLPRQGNDWSRACNRLSRDWSGSMVMSAPQPATEIIKRLTALTKHCSTT